MSNDNRFCKMKRTIALLAAAAAVLCACADKNEPENPNPPAPSVEDEHFTIKVDNVRGSIADITITRTDDVDTWYWDIAPAEDTVNEEYIADTFSSLYQIVCDIYGDVPYSEFLSVFMLYSKDTKVESYTYTGLNPNSDYVVFAVGVDGEGNVVTDIATVNFSTVSPVPSTVTFEFRVEGADLYVTPSSDDEPYAWTYFAQSEIDQFGGTPEDYMKAILEEFVEAGNGSAVTSFGPAEEKNAQYLEAGTNYIAAVGWDGACTTEVYIHEFESDGADKSYNTLPGNVDITLTDVLDASDYAAYYGVGRNLYLNLSNAAGESVILDLIAPADAVSLVGTYEISATPAENTAMCGTLENGGYLNGSWFFTYIGGQINNPACTLESGTVVVSDNGGGYRIEVDAVAGAFSVKAVYDGEAFDFTVPSNSAPAASRAAKKDAALSIAKRPAAAAASKGAPLRMPR